MSGDGRRILESALALPPVERAELVEELLSSFDFPARADVDALWAREAEDRIDAYEKGELSARPASATAAWQSTVLVSSRPTAVASGWACSGGPAVGRAR